jgi:hypothetical protein
MARLPPDLARICVENPRIDDNGLAGGTVALVGVRGFHGHDWIPDRMSNFSAFATFFVLTFGIVSLYGQANDPARDDHIARAELLLEEFAHQDRTTSSLRRYVRYILHQHSPTLRDTSLISEVKAFFCDESLAPMVRAENLLLIAQWQHDAGLHKDAMTTLDAALEASSKVTRTQCHASRHRRPPVFAI